MNRENVIALRDHFKTIPAEQFDMNKWLCGSIGCIAGHAVMLAAANQQHQVHDISAMAREWLGLSHFQAKSLFTPSMGVSGIYCYILPWDVVEVLDHFLETGAINFRASPRLQAQQEAISRWSSLFEDFSFNRIYRQG